MSGLNASLGYFLSVLIFTGLLHWLLKRWPRFSFVSEFASSSMLVACWLEIHTIMEVGQWAGGLGQDVTVTMLFVLLLIHGVLFAGTSGNPSLVVQKFLQVETCALPTVLAVAAQFIGAHLGMLAAGYYWSLELTDMHMIKNLMSSECTTSLNVSVVQGFFTECFCALIFHLIHLNLQRRSALIRVPLIAVLLTFFSHIARSYTSGYMNPSLAYGLTFHCPGFSLKEYAVVYWLSSFTGMMLALLLYMGHIPRLFAKNLLYFQKTRFKVPKGDKPEKKKK